jgi:hypothetical protein
MGCSTIFIVVSGAALKCGIVAIGSIGALSAKAPVFEDDGMRIILVLTLGAAIGLAVGCTQRPLPPAAPRHAAARLQPPDWFHQQVVAARAARRAHQPKADTAGAQRAYDEVMTAACTRAASAGPGKYPARCDAILHPPLDQSAADPCAGRDDDPALQAECND